MATEITTEELKEAHDHTCSALRELGAAIGEERPGRRRNKAVAAALNLMAGLQALGATGPVVAPVEVEAVEVETVGAAS